MDVIMAELPDIPTRQKLSQYITTAPLGFRVQHNGKPSQSMYAVPMSCLHHIMSRMRTPWLRLDATFAWLSFALTECAS